MCSAVGQRALKEGIQESDEDLTVQSRLWKYWKHAYAKLLQSPKDINAITVNYLFRERMFSHGKAIAQRCFCAEQDTRPETGRPEQQQLS